MSTSATLGNAKHLLNLADQKGLTKEGCDALVQTGLLADLIEAAEAGNLAEGSTENFTLLDKNGVLIVPKFDRILRGITAVRAMELAAQSGIKAENRSITMKDVHAAKGAMMMGTTIDILPVASFEDVTFKLMPEETRRLMSAFILDLETGPLRTAF